MNPQQFKQVEDDYFRLKGLLAAGRMDRQQFEQALAQLVFADEQGRRWMIGVDDAKWYVNEGQSWVLGNPLGGPIPIAYSTSTPAQTSRQGPSLPVILLGSVIVLGCIGGALGIWLAAFQGWLRIGPARPTTVLILPTPFSMPTQYIPPTPFVIPTPYPSPQPPPTRPPIPANPAPTLIPPTLPPTATTVPTETPTPTVTPTPTQTPTPPITPKPQGNCADPNARWENVVDGQNLDPYQAFIGTANGPDFAGYVVEWQRPGNVLHRSTTPVTHGVIFVWNTYTVERGVYPVALTVVLKDGTTLASCVVEVRVVR